MKKIFAIISFLIIIFKFSYSQDLPNYMTEQEKQIYRTYQPPVMFTDDVNPPVTPVRTMAEWEELRGTLITWTSYTSILAQIVKYSQEEGLVYIVCSDSNSVKNYLTSNSIPLVNLKFLITSFNSVWCRDYGPWCIYTLGADTMKFVDWIYNRPRPLDDVIPVSVANYLSIPIHQTTVTPNNLTATGGNFMVDGNNTGFSSKLILNENPGKTEAEIDTIMKKYMGLSRYIKMNTLPYDGIHHIDMHMKMLDEETILVGQYPLGVSDGPQIEANLQALTTNYQTCYGKPFKIVRIPMPPSSSGQYPPNSDYFTYTNSTFVNKTVIVPIYGFSQDTTALRIYRESLPGYRVVGILCNSIIPASGAIHCITKEIGVSEPIFISHSILRNTNNTTTPYEVKAYIKTKSGVANAKVYWTIDTSAGFSQLNMTATADTFRAYIPNQSLGTKIYYYITATSNSNRVVSKPITAPAGRYKFSIENPVIISGNEKSQMRYELKQNYPNPFNPSTTIEYSIPENGYIKIEVFDISGRLIRILINDFIFAGNYKVKFNPDGLSSGIYFYKLSSYYFSDVKKMLFIK